MTTILADFNLGLICADSQINDGVRKWQRRKVHRIGGVLIGCAGAVSSANAFLDWYRAGMLGEPKFERESFEALVLGQAGLFTFDESTPGLQRVPGGVEAIGSGGMAAIAAYEAMGYDDPKRAVAIACRHDVYSAAPVRIYRL